jgi:hypothetical protein
MRFANMMAFCVGDESVATLSLSRLAMFWRLCSVLILLPFRLVIETLDPLDGDRKCFRMVNGVLVERTVKDVLPTLKTNSDGLKQVLDDMLKQYKSKQTELDNWKVSKSLGSLVLWA